MTSTANRPVIICTAKRGVFYGKTEVPAETILREGIVSLAGARMAIYWGTTKGVMELADTGPTSKTRIGAKANISLNEVTAVFEVTDTAAEKWEAS